jgi:hypothetical protein
LSGIVTLKGSSQNNKVRVSQSIDPDTVHPDRPSESRRHGNPKDNNAKKQWTYLSGYLGFLNTQISSIWKKAF